MLSVLLQYQKSRNFYSQAAEQYTSLVLSDLPTGEEDLSAEGDAALSQEGALETKDRLSERAPLTVDFEALQAVNPDIIGWIYCADTIINYPVLQGEDNDFYLQHSYDKNPLKQGSIFIDVENKRDFSDRNTIIYGHHMNDGSMFSELLGYEDGNYCKAHPEIILETENGAEIYQVAAVIRAAGSYAPGEWSVFDQINISAGAFNTFVENLNERRLYDTGREPVFGDKLLTLVTCEYSQRNGRLAVVAVKL